MGHLDIGDIGIMALADVLILSFLLYVLLLWFRKTKSAYVFVGTVICTVAYVAAQLLKLELTVSLMRHFFTIFMVGVVVIFQEDIRRALEHIAKWSLAPKFRMRTLTDRCVDLTELIGNAVFDLAREKVGAIVVLTGRDSVDRHVQGGTQLDGILSGPLLTSIFDPHSAGHDGAAVVQRDRVVQFASQLPLSKNPERLGGRGTRHAAALGLSELVDALCITVSQEKGTVSISRHGASHLIRGERELSQVVEDFFRETGHVPQSRRISGLWTRNLKEKFTAVLASVVLWFTFVHQSEIVYKSFMIPVQYAGLRATSTAKDVDPDAVKVVLSGRRSDFYFVDTEDVVLMLRLFDLERANVLGEGLHELTITASDIRLPPDLLIINIFPRTVRLRISPQR